MRFFSTTINTRNFGIFRSWKGIFSKICFCFINGRNEWKPIINDYLVGEQQNQYNTSANWSGHRASPNELFWPSEFYNDRKTTQNQIGLSPHQRIITLTTATSSPIRYWNSPKIMAFEHIFMNLYASRRAGAFHSAVCVCVCLPSASFLHFIIIYRWRCSIEYCAVGYKMKTTRERNLTIERIACF